MIVIEEHRLAAVAEIGTGSARTITLVTCPDPGLPAEMAYKALPAGLDPTTGRRLAEQLRTAVGFRDTMSPDELAELDDVANWPLAVVVRDGRPVGCLSRMVGRDFFLDTRPAGGGPAPRLLDLSLLSIPDDRLWTLGIEQPLVDDDLVRLALLARLAYAVEVVHRPRGGRRLVFGDLSLRSAAVAVGPPRVRLLDCDGVADLADTDRLQPNTPFFVPPELADRQQLLQDQVTDVYKLALCVIRGLATGRGAAQLTDPVSPLVRPGLLDRDGAGLLGRALSGDRGLRPTAEEIKDYLVGRVLQLAERQWVRQG